MQHAQSPRVLTSRNKDRFHENFDTLFSINCLSLECIWMQHLEFILDSSFHDRCVCVFYLMTTMNLKYVRDLTLKIVQGVILLSHPSFTVKSFIHYQIYHTK